MIPAPFTRISRPSPTELASATAASISPCLVTSQVTASATPPWPRIVSTVAWASPALRSAQITTAPSRASATAISRLMPLAAPVTRAVFPENFIAGSQPVFLCYPRATGLTRMGGDVPGHGEVDLLELFQLRHMSRACDD